MTNLDLVTGAFSYSGAGIAQRLVDSGREVRTLTFHPDRPHPLRPRVEALPYRFDDPDALARSLEGVDCLYNTYWVRFDHADTTFRMAVSNSAALFEAARRASVRRIVHISIANPSLESELPYYHGKAEVEQALARSGVPCSIVRPTLVFGGDRDVLVNNIAWLLRHLPVFGVPGSGDYLVQPVHVDDLARVCVEAAQVEGNVTWDAAGPETMTFKELVRAVREAVGSHSPILSLPPALMALISRALGVLVRDVVLTPDEIRGLSSGLLASHEPPRATISFTQWLREHHAALGRAYANELARHFDSHSPSVGWRVPEEPRLATDR